MMVKPQNGSRNCLPSHLDRRVKYFARQNDAHFGSITVGLYISNSAIWVMVRAVKKSQVR